MPRSRRLLEIYLTDHHAGSTLGIELAKRAAHNNRGTGTGEFLERLVSDIEADREVLERLLAQLGMHSSRLKRISAWLAERLSRLKTNGQLRGYSPLSRLQELEGLSIGIAGKQALWESLVEVPQVARLVDFTELVERARRQRAEVELHRLEATMLAFAGEVVL